jgi:hypothetical protein
VLDLLYELCWQIGGDRCLHPDYLARHLTNRQIAGWLAWMKLEPRGDRREDVRLAILRSDVRAPYMSRSESPNDLLPKYRADNVMLDPEVEQLVNDFLQPLPIKGV